MCAPHAPIDRLDAARFVFVVVRWQSAATNIFPCRFFVRYRHRHRELAASGGRIKSLQINIDIELMAFAFDTRN